MTIRKVLSDIKINNKTIFHAVEQGHGARSKDVFAHYYPEYKKLVLQWFNKQFMSGIQLVNQQEIETSIVK